MDSSPLHWWFGRGGPIDNLGSSSLYHCVQWFSDTGRANAGCGDVGSTVGVAAAMMVGGAVVGQTAIVVKLFLFLVAFCQSRH